MAVQLDSTYKDVQYRGTFPSAEGGVGSSRPSIPVEAGGRCWRARGGGGSRPCWALTFVCLANNIIWFVLTGPPVAVTARGLCRHLAAPRR
eukprot:30063-Pyramimonas_sp.AAC.1